VILSVVLYILIGANIVFAISWIMQQMSNMAGDIIQQPVVQKEPEKKPEVRSQQQTARRKPVEKAPPARVSGKISVEILNGCGVDGAAAVLRDHLIAAKFDVVDYKNADNFFYNYTYVIDRIYLDKRNARKVATEMQVTSDYVIPQISEARKVDVTVIIGKDLGNYNVFKNLPNLLNSRDF